MNLKEISVITIITFIIITFIIVFIFYASALFFSKILFFSDFKTEEIALYEKNDISENDYEKIISLIDLEEIPESLKLYSIGYEQPRNGDTSYYIEFYVNNSERDKIKFNSYYYNIEYEEHNDLILIKCEKAISTSDKEFIIIKELFKKYK